MKILKSEGITQTEKLLASLCERSFLKLWSYPNPFKDDGHELCDLLAVFENHIFVFFDREGRQLDDQEKDPTTSWERWKRRVIEDQIRTAKGAERYIRSGRATFLDSTLQTPFPIAIDIQNAVFHKIIVAHGAAEACLRSSKDNVYGSLAVIYGSGGPSSEFPFMVALDREDPIHVLDSHNLQIILGELDTAQDLVSYLTEKLVAIRRYSVLTYCGEEDLLAHYLYNYDKESKRHIIGTKQRDINFLAIGEGEWRDFVKLEQYIAKKQSDEISYFWDDLIQRTCQNAFDGTLIGNATLLRGKSAIHEMAKEPRFMRRALSSKMIEAIRNFPESSAALMRNLSFMPSYHEGKGYVFLQVKADINRDYDTEIRPVRQEMLRIACAAAKNKFSTLKSVIGIAIDAPKYSEKNSEDFVLLECNNWSEEQRAHYEEANRELKFFETGKLYRTTVSEFPTVVQSGGASPRIAKIGRNESCPCGSGKKFKRCCLSQRR